VLDGLKHTQVFDVSEFAMAFAKSSWSSSFCGSISTLFINAATASSNRERDMRALAFRNQPCNWGATSSLGLTPPRGEHREQYLGPDRLQLNTKLGILEGFQKHAEAHVCCTTIGIEPCITGIEVDGLGVVFNGL